MNNGMHQLAASMFVLVPSCLRHVQHGNEIVKNQNVSSTQPVHNQDYLRFYSGSLTSRTLGVIQQGCWTRYKTINFVRCTAPECLGCPHISKPIVRNVGTERKKDTGNATSKPPDYQVTGKKTGGSEGLLCERASSIEGGRVGSTAHTTTVVKPLGQ